MKNTSYIRVIIPEHINKEHKHYTYAHILDGESLPFYIGIGTQIKGGVKYGRSISKTGRNKFWKEKTKNRKYYIVICTSSDDYELINTHEIECIEELGKEIDGGELTNISDGGKGCLGYKHTEEHKNVLRVKYSGKNNPMYGKKMSVKTRKRMSNSQKGRTHNDYTKNILREKAKLRGYVGPIGGEHCRARKVKQIDPVSKQIINIFHTVKDAAKVVGVTDKAIGKSCRKGFKVKLFNWEYV